MVPSIIERDLAAALSPQATTKNLPHLVGPTSLTITTIATSLPPAHSRQPAKIAIASKTTLAARERKKSPLCADTVRALPFTFGLGKLSEIGH